MEEPEEFPYALTQQNTVGFYSSHIMNVTLTYKTSTSFWICALSRKTESEDLVLWKTCNRNAKWGLVYLSDLLWSLWASCRQGSLLQCVQVYQRQRNRRKGWPFLWYQKEEKSIGSSYILSKGQVFFHLNVTNCLFLWSYFKKKSIFSWGRVKKSWAFGWRNNNSNKEAFSSRGPQYKLSLVWQSRVRVMNGYALNEIVLQAEKACGYISSFFTDFLEG